MKYILCNPRLTKSGIVLAKKLSELVGEEILVKTELDRTMTIRDKFTLRNQCVLRYGNSRFGDIIGNDVDNKVALIMSAGNKLSLSNFLDTKEFPHIQFYRKNPEDSDFPIVARDELNRGGGIGIRVIENMEDFENSESVNYWSPWYNFKFELGVHILGGKIVRVFKKLRDEKLEPEEYPIRNTQRGYHFSLRENWKSRYAGLDKFVAKLYEIFPIEFARLDIGYDKETGGYRLIEINSAPDLSQNKNTLELYAKFLAERIK